MKLIREDLFVPYVKRNNEKDEVSLHEQFDRDHEFV